MQKSVTGGLLPDLGSLQPVLPTGSAGDTISCTVSSPIHRAGRQAPSWGELLPAYVTALSPDERDFCFVALWHFALLGLLKEEKA